MKRSIRNMLERVGRAGRPSSAAFTLIELLIAVGALAVIAAGVAAIFEATGRTVQAGRRVSTMASYASLIERRMRDDFAGITRDGFLIIKNMYATGTGDAYPAGNPPDIQDAVPLSEADEHPRLRRTDEIMFFVKGQFVSVRELLDGRFVAKADAAAVYYGHGQRAYPQPYNQLEPYYWPSVGDPPFNSNARLGYQGDPGNPNRYASDWILVRHATLLRPGQTSTVQLLPLPFGLSPARMTDSDIQIALQPAESNLFRWLSHIQFGGPTSFVRDTFDNVLPQRRSGLVDIATTNLSEIRAIITTADRAPMAGGQLPDATFFDPASNNAADGSNKGVDGQSRPYPADLTIIEREQAWMDDGLPAGSTVSTPQNRTRIRCEPAPNNYVGVLSPQTAFPSLVEQPCRRADQIMLAASNFLPHCTEFIVEWSFGKQYTSDPSDPNYAGLESKAGQLIWYGMPRKVNGDMVANTYGVAVQTMSPNPVHFPYPWQNPLDPQPQYYERVDGGSLPGGARPSHDLDWALVHSPFLSAADDPGQVVTSYFGYNDPTFDPENPQNLTSAPPHNGLLDAAAESRSPTIPWAWPRFIRVTLSLADPNNPSVEQSFQFVFEVPSTPTP